MIVRVRAGTTLEELRAAVHAGGQDVALDADDPARATVGGILAVGRSGYRRLGLGPVRDAVLEVTAVSARGELIRSGAPLVKNVTGFDLCRLLVGSLGTLALLGEVVLRCRPRVEMEAWWVADGRRPFRAGRHPLPAPVGAVGRQPHLGRAGGLRGRRARAGRGGARTVLRPGGRAAGAAGSGPEVAPAGGAARPARRARCRRGLAGRGRRRSGALHAGGGRPAAGAARPGPEAGGACTRALKERFDPGRAAQPRPVRPGRRPPREDVMP